MLIVVDSQKYARYISPTMKNEWIKLRYTTSEGDIVKEIWTKILVQGIDHIDKDWIETIAQASAPKITYEVVGRRETKPSYLCSE